MPAGEALSAFATAAFAADADAITAARDALQAELSAEAVVDAAAVAAQLQMMVRIVDSAGTPLDAPIEMASRSLRDDIGVADFASASHTEKPGLLQSLGGMLLEPLTGAVFRARAKKRE